MPTAGIYVSAGTTRSGKPKRVRVRGTRKEKRGSKTFTVLELAPGKARGVGAAAYAWKKPLRAKKSRGADPLMARGDRVFRPRDVTTTDEVVERLRAGRWQDAQSDGRMIEREMTP